MLTDKELKLVRLALDPGATQGEWNNAAVAFFRSARTRSASAEEFNRNGSTALVVPPMPADWGLTIMPWGKYRGELFKDISPDYLKFARKWILEDPDRAAKMKNLAEAIKAFLKQ